MVRWLVFAALVVAEIGKSCVTVTSDSLDTIAPYSTICNVSTKKELRFQGLNLTGVTFDFLEATLGVSFDENCTLDGMKINGILINQGQPRRALSQVRFFVDTPLKGATILLVRVAGKTEFTKRIIRSNIGSVYSNQDVIFRFPVTESSIDRIAAERMFLAKRAVIFSRVVDTSIGFIEGREIILRNFISSNLTSASGSALHSGVRILRAASSSFGSLEGCVVHLHSLSTCTVDKAVAEEFVVIDKIKGSSFGVINGKAFYESENYPQSVYLDGVSDSNFEYIEAGGGDYYIEFSGPVRKSKFGFLKGQVNFLPNATLLGSTFDTIYSIGDVLWQNRMKRTEFLNVTATYNLLLLTNISEIVATSFGDLTAERDVGFTEPRPLTLPCSSLSIGKLCGVVINNKLQKRSTRCPVCVP